MSDRGFPVGMNCVSGEMSAGAIGEAFPINLSDFVTNTLSGVRGVFTSTHSCVLKERTWLY